MILNKTQTLNENQPLPGQIRILDLHLRKLFDALRGRVRFGTYTSGNTNLGENIAGQFVSFTSDASANTEFSVTHNLGAIPIGYIVFYQDKAGSLYQTPTNGTDWTATTVYLKCSVSSVAFLVFLVK